jgi:hypothetical protein
MSHEPRVNVRHAAARANEAPAARHSCASRSVLKKGTVATTAGGALRTFVLRCFERAEPRPGGVLRFAATVVPAGRLRCAARLRGRVAELASRPSAATLRQPRPSQFTFRASRSAPPPALLAAAKALRPPPGHVSANTSVVFAASWAGGRWRDFCGGEEHRTQGRARSALRELTWSRLVERSERSERSEFRDRPCGRCREPGHGPAPAGWPVPGERPGACKRQGTQWSRCAAPTAAAERRRLPAQGAARAERCMKAVVEGPQRAAS